MAGAREWESKRETLTFCHTQNLYHRASLECDESFDRPQPFYANTNFIFIVSPVFWIIELIRCESESLVNLCDDVYSEITELGLFDNEPRSRMTQFLLLSKRNRTAINYRQVIECLYFSLKFKHSVKTLIREIIKVFLVWLTPGYRWWRQQNFITK